METVSEEKTESLGYLEDDELLEMEKTIQTAYGVK